MIAELPFDASCVLRGFDSHEIFIKMATKMEPKMDDKSSLGHPRVQILRFREAFWGGVFLMNFRSAKSGPKIRKWLARRAGTAMEITGWLHGSPLVGLGNIYIYYIYK